MGWPPRAWGEARRAGGYKRPSVPTETLAKGHGPTEGTDAEGNPRRLGCVRRCSTSCPRFLISGKSHWLVVSSSAGSHLPARMCASVQQALKLYFRGGFHPLWSSEALETGRTGSAELTDLYKADWFMYCPTGAS